ESPLVAGIFGLRSHGLIFGVTGFAFTIGGAIGPSLTGYIFDATHSYQLAFLASGIAALLGLILTLVLRPIKHKRLQV
ncbi:MAG: hypothetical protein Q8O16_03840, partial [Dehalococcoidia bacterium]|nr:hypothetical protein [Dehalococcoidia bacterium]